MPQHPPKIGAVSNRLGANSARVAYCVEALLIAVQRADWQEIERLAASLAAGENGCDDTVHYRARRVCEELQKPNNSRAIRHSVVRLIGASGHTPAT